MGDGISTLSDCLKELGFEVHRFKTGTPCRLNGRSINLEKCEKQTGDDPPPNFSFLSDTISSCSKDGQNTFTLNNWSDPTFHVEQLPCWITYTNSKTHEIINDNLDQSPMYSGIIEGLVLDTVPLLKTKSFVCERETSSVFGTRRKTNQ